MSKITPNYPNIPFPVGAVDVANWEPPKVTGHP